MANYLYNSNGLPADNLGNPGDLYLDEDTYIVYGPKTSAGWPSTGKSLAGPKGDPGPKGDQGVQGERGEIGPVGTTIWRGQGSTPPDAVLAAAKAEDYYLDLSTGLIYPFIDDSDPASSGAPPITMTPIN